MQGEKTYSSQQLEHVTELPQTLVTHNFASNSLAKALNERFKLLDNGWLEEHVSVSEKIRLLGLETELAGIVDRAKDTQNIFGT